MTNTKKVKEVCLEVTYIYKIEYDGTIFINTNFKDDEKDTSRGVNNG